MKPPVPNDPRCRDWRACSKWETTTHGSVRPERWAENGGKSPEWRHASLWSDVRLALDMGLPVFMYSGVQIENGDDLNYLLQDGVDKTGSSLSFTAQVLIPKSLDERLEQQAIESIRKHEAQGGPHV